MFPPSLEGRSFASPPPLRGGGEGEGDVASDLRIGRGTKNVGYGDPTLQKMSL